MALFLIITGMHRSGTSFLVRALNLAGVYLGDLKSITSHELEFNPDNLRGHWENKKLLELTEKTLAYNDGSWDIIPESVIISDKIGKEVKKTISNLAKCDALAVGFKDPRILICLESWEKFFPKEILIVGIFRHPLKVAESLKIRNKFNYKKSLELWKIYNQKLLSSLEQFGGFLLDFDSPKEKLFSEIKLISEKLGLAKNIDLNDWYSKELFHSDKTFNSDYNLTPEILELYDKLKERSKHNVEFKKTISRNKQDLTNIIESLLQQIREESIYYKKSFGEMPKKISILDSQMKKAINDVSTLEAENLKNQSFISDSQSFLIDKESQLSDLKSSLTDKDSQMKKAINAVSTLQDENLKNQSLISNLQSSLTDKDSQMKKAINAVSILQAENLKNQSLISNLQSSLTDKVSQLSVIQSSISYKEPQISDLKSSLTDRESQLSDLKSSLTTKESQISDLKSSLTDKESQLSDLKSSLTDRESQLSDLKSSLTDKDSQMKKAINDVSILQDENLKNQSLISDLQSSLTDKASQFAMLQSSVESSQEQILDIHQSFVFRMLHKYDTTLGKFLPLRPKKYLPSSKRASIDQPSIVKKALTNIQLTKKDIICFPIINWDYRYQRPQHILEKFSDKGHRVFYLTVSLEPLDQAYHITELRDNIYQIELNSPKFFDIFKDKFNESLVSRIITSIKEIIKDLNLDAISFVEFPTWTPLVIELRKQFDYKIIFDCLDEFTGFSNVIKAREKEEKILLKNSDFVTCSSLYLSKKIQKLTSNLLYLPNAGEFNHFNKTPSELQLQKYKKPIIGYFGSIAEWFDNKLIEYVAKNRPELTFILIGHTFGSNIKKLMKLENVHFLGERPYSELPKYLHAFDVCLIPFRNVPLIEATHPVKIYEYMAAGKPVVATNMKELSPMKEICYISKNKEDFLKNLNRALDEKDKEIVQKRIDFASKNTWDHRINSLYSELEKIKLINLHHHN